MAKSQRSSAYRFGLNIGHVITRVLFGLITIPLVYGMGGWLLRMGFSALPEASMAFNMIFYYVTLYLFLPASAVFGAYLLLTSLYAIINFAVLTVDERGVTLKSTFKNKHWDWEDLTKVVNKTQEGTYVTRTGEYGNYMTMGAYDVYEGDKKAFGISAFFSRFKDAVELVEKHIAYMTLSDTFDELKAGRRVKFGKVTVSRNGVTSGKKTVGWKEIRTFTTDEMALMIQYPKGVWRLLLKNIENQQLLVHILDMVVHKRQIAPPVFFRDSGV